MNYLITITFFFLLLNNVNAQERTRQETKIGRSYMGDTLSTRYGKGVHFFSSVPAVTLYFSNYTKEKSIIGLGSEVGYGYYLLNNWSIGSNFSYMHFFTNPKNQANAYSLSLYSKYYFFPKKTFSFFTGLEGQISYFTYTTKLETPNFVYYNDPVDNSIHKHLIPIIRPVLGLSIKVMQNFTIQALVGYTHSFYEKEGNGKAVLSKAHQYAYIVYHFNRKKKINYLPNTNY